MRFPLPLTPGILQRRYKRFLADVTLPDGETVTAHCANPGAMTGLDAAGSAVWLSRSDNPGRKLAYSLELVEVDMGAGPVLVGINTAHPNRLVEEAIPAGAIPALAGYPALRREVRYGRRSRVDFVLTGSGSADCYVEVKNVHLMRTPGLAEFPDSVTARGTRHLDDLADVARAGHRAAMLYVVQRGDADRFALARDIDPAYAQAFARAREAGVEAHAVRCEVTCDGIEIGRAVPFVPSPALDESGASA